MTLEGKRYERWTAEDPIEAGDPLQALAIARSNASSVPVVAAIAGAVLLMVAVGAIARARRQVTSQATPRQAEHPLERSMERDALLEDVARLDLDFASGTIRQPEYDDRRADLIGRLKEIERR